MEFVISHLDFGSVPSHVIAGALEPYLDCSANIRVLQLDLDII